MTKSPFMFANKFLHVKDALVTLCLGEWMANKTLDFYTGNTGIDTTIYETSMIVTNRLTDYEYIPTDHGTNVLEFKHTPIHS